MTSETIKDMTYEARRLLDNNQLMEAKRLFTEIRDQDGSNAEAWLMLGAIDGETGNVSGAVTAVQKAIDLDPGYAEAHMTLAHLLQASGDLEGALAAARAAANSDPGYGEAVLLQATLSGRLGKLLDAESFARRAIALLPNDAPAQATLGNIQHQLGKLMDAGAAFRKALQLNPNLAGALSGYGGVLIGEKKFADARGRLARALELQPDLVEAHNNMGILQMSLGEYDNARESFNRVLSLAPGFAQAHANLGNLQAEQGDYAGARDCYRRALEFSPQLVEAHLALGNACKALGERDAAREHYERAIELKPGFLAAHYNLGILEEELGNLDRAMRCFDEVSRLDPGNIEAQAARAGVHEKQGACDDAWAMVDPLLGQGTMNVRLGQVFARLCEQRERREEAMLYLQGLEQLPNLGRGQRADIRFSLGMLQDRAGDYDAAFASFSQANELLAPAYDPAGYRAYVDGVIAANTSASLGALPAPAGASKRPVFIIGMPRSGTTLVEQIIAAHPQAEGGGELGAMFALTGELQSLTGSDQPYPGCIADIDQAAMDGMAGRYLSELKRVSSEAARVTDKMPHNFQHLGLIHTLFPEAAIIHVSRNPLDTCLSCYFHRFGGHHPYAYRLQDLADHYREYRRLMQHWRDALQLPMLEVPYEDLVADPEAVSRQLVEHCGLDWDERCLDFHRSERIAATASYEQVRQPIYSSAVNRWQHYRQHLGPLLEAFPAAD